jgi:hypothetical protein
MYYASAAFQLAFGRTLLSEALLVFGGLALAAAITCWIVLRLTGSALVASVVTLFQIAIAPRSYGYPKLLLYVLAIAGIHFYAQSPGRLRAALLGVLTAAAFLMRHDHGVFIGVACVAAIVLVEFRQSAGRVGRALAMYSAATILALAPYLVLVGSTVGLDAYVEDGIAFSRAEAARSSLDDLPDFVPGFLPGVAPDAGESAAVVNAEAWLFYLPWGVAAAALARLFHTRDRTGAPIVVAAVLLSALTAASFLRSPLSERLADIWGPLPIALAYAIAPAFRRREELGPGARALGRVAVALVLVLTSFSVGVVGRVPEVLDEAGLSDGPEEVMDRLDEVTDELSVRAADERALELAEPDDDRAALTYLSACTEPSDRILVFTFAPEIFYLTERGFAGGHVAFVVGYHGSEEDQRQTIERWRRQSVPLAVMVEDAQREAERYFPLVAEELARRYVPVLRIADNGQGDSQGDSQGGSQGGEPPLLVMAERARAARSTYGPSGLPCFADPAGAS